MTAVITKYEKDFKRWCNKYPNFPDPVWISSLEDIGDRRFFYVKKATRASIIFNLRIIEEECKNRINLYVAYISMSPKQARLHNKKFKAGIERYPAKTIDSVLEARRYHYIDVVLCSRYALPEFWEKIMCICEARFVVDVPKNQTLHVAND